MHGVGGGLASSVFRGGRGAIDLSEADRDMAWRYALPATRVGCEAGDAGRPAGSEIVKTQHAEPVRSRWIARAFIRSPGLIADSSCREMFLLRENIPCSFVFVRLGSSSLVSVG